MLIPAGAQIFIEYFDISDYFDSDERSSLLFSDYRICRFQAVSTPTLPRLGIAFDIGSTGAAT